MSADHLRARRKASWKHFMTVLLPLHLGTEWEMFRKKCWLMNLGFAQLEVQVKTKWGIFHSDHPSHWTICTHDRSAIELIDPKIPFQTLITTRSSSVNTPSRKSRFVPPKSTQRAAGDFSPCFWDSTIMWQNHAFLQINLIWSVRRISTCKLTSGEAKCFPNTKRGLVSIMCPRSICRDIRCWISRALVFVSVQGERPRHKSLSCLRTRGSTFVAMTPIHVKKAVRWVTVVTELSFHHNCVSLIEETVKFAQLL